MAAKSYSFGKSAHRILQVKHMKELSRKGLNVASSGATAFPAGSSVRFKHRPGGGR